MKTIRSGFQSGVDISAIHAAHSLALPTTGAMPKGFKTERDGKVEYHPEYAALYGAYEMSTSDYPARTRENVAKADATLILRHKESKGTDLTRWEAIKAKKPVTIFDYCIEDGQVQKIFVRSYHGGLWQPAEIFATYDTINIAGNRDADEKAVCAWLVGLMRQVLEGQGEV